MSLFTRIVVSDPASIIARRNLSGAYAKALGDPVENGREATHFLEESLTILYASQDWRIPRLAAWRAETDLDLIRRVQANQGNHVEPEAWLGELFGQLGYALSRERRIAESRRAFETALAISPKNAGARLGMAQFAIQEGSYEEAVSHLRIAQSVWTFEPSIPAMLGRAHLQLGHPEIAIRSLRQSVSMQPWFGPTYLDLADAYVATGDTAQAVETLRASQECRVQDKVGLEERLQRLGQPLDHVHP